MGSKTNEQIIAETARNLTDNGFDGVILIGVKDNKLCYQSSTKGEKAFSVISALNLDIMDVIQEYGE